MFKRDVFLCPLHHAVSVKAFGFRTVRFVKLMNPTQAAAAPGKHDTSAMRHAPCAAKLNPDQTLKLTYLT